jgi:rare lipoprotein A
MDGKSTSNRARRTRLLARPLGPFAALALLGVTGAGYAQQQQPVDLAGPADAGLTAPARALPMFEPSADAQFEQAFARLGAPVQPEPADHAVDITTIEPTAADSISLGSGVASYYGRRFHGRRTASGENFDMHLYTAAHRTLPFGSLVRVTNPRNGSSVVVRINDRGPFTRGRTIDLSRAAAEDIGIIAAGHGDVELELVEG